jgi:hypothetical protein
MIPEVTNNNQFEAGSEKPDLSARYVPDATTHNPEGALLNRAVAYLREQVRPFLYDYLLSLREIQRTEGAVPARRLDEHHAKPLGFLFSRICSKQDAPILERAHISGGKCYKLTDLGLRAIEILEAQKV